MKETATEQAEKMLTQPPLKIIWKQSSTNMIAFTIMGFYALVDAIFISNFFSVDGVGAQSVANTFEFCFAQLMPTALSIGLSAMLGPLLAKRDYDGCSKCASQFLLIELIYGALLTIFCEPFVKQIYYAMGGSKKDIQVKYGMQYLHIILGLGPYAYAMNQGFQPILRAENKTTLCMILQGGTGVLNIIIDCIFFFSLSKQLEMFIPALSTCLSLWTSGLITMYYLISRKSSNLTKFAWKNMKLTWNFFKNIISQAIPTFINSLPFVIGQICSFQQINKYEKDEIHNDMIRAIYGTSFRYGVLVIQPLQGVYYAYISILSINLAKKYYGRVRDILKHCLWIGTLTGLILTTIIIILMPQLLWIFNPTTSKTSGEFNKELIKYGTKYARLAFCGYWIGLPMLMVSGLFQMSQKPFIACIFQICRLVLGLTIIYVMPAIGIKVDYMLMQGGIAELIMGLVCTGFILYFVKKYDKMDKEQVRQTDLVAFQAKDQEGDQTIESKDGSQQPVTVAQTEQQI